MSRHDEEHPTLRVHRAVGMAMRLHGDQTRKVGGLPVMSHLFTVAMLTAIDGGEPDEVIAALLHDSIEDAPDRITIEEIQEEFGPNVANMVLVATDSLGGPDLTWAQRKEAYIKQIAAAPPSTLRPIVADKFDNIISSIDGLERAPQDVARITRGGKKVEYFQSVLSAVRTAGFDSELVGLLAAAVVAFGRLTQEAMENERRKEDEGSASAGQEKQADA